MAHIISLIISARGGGYHKFHSVDVVQNNAIKVNFGMHVVIFLLRIYGLNMDMSDLARGWVCSADWSR